MKQRNEKPRFRIFTIIKLCASYCTAYFSACLILTVIDGLMLPFMMFTVAKFIDAAVTIASPNPDTKGMLIYLVLTVFGYMYSQLAQEFKQYSYDLLENALRSKLRPKAIKKVFDLDYQTFEASATQDLLFRVMDDIEIKFTRVIRSVNTTIAVMIQVLGVLYAVAIYNLWLALGYIAVMVPTILLTFKNGRVIYQKDKKVVFITRQMNYLSEVLTSREAADERTLFGYGGGLNQRFEQAHLYRSNYNTKVLAKETSGSMLVNVVISIFTVFTVFVLSRQIATGSLSVGLFTSMIGSMIALSKTVSFQSSELVLEFSTHYEYAKDFNELMTLQGKGVNCIDSGKLEPFESLEIINLKFKYKDSSEYILKGVNLSLWRGKSYSLVGLNGAGKSTLVKIIVGLYRDYEGQILLNGRDLRTYDFSELQGMFSVVSQDFAKYYVSFKDNITFSHKDGDVSKVISQLDLDKLVDSLPLKEHSHLGKVYEDGVDISGGEWQKLAIARALYKDCPFMIMDEPTASLSPTSESSLYIQFMNIARHKTLIMITHRLGSTKIADEIIVLDQGIIAEKGSHEELMESNNIYAQLFKRQSEMYD